MRWRVLAFVSLGVNLVLAAVWLAYHRPANPRGGAALASADASTNTLGRPNILLRRQFFSWQEIESPDYQVYIANLRDIGCPEQTIRDIIIADVNGLYARKRAELVTPQQQWWRSEPDTNVLAVALQKTRELDDERRALLTRLLGPNWEAGDLVNLPRPSRPGVVLDGPVLGSLSPETKQAIADLSQRSEERLQAYLDAQRALGKDPDPVELAKLRQQTRTELAHVLSPTQLEEFLLRYSQYANNLRSDFGQLRFFDATPDEFRAVFRATDPIDQQIQMLADATDPNSVQARKALQDQRENAIKAALGPQRYDEYRMLHDPLYRDAVATAQDAGTPEAAQALYQINLAAMSSQDAIRTNTNLTADQKAIELKRLELQQLEASTLATGGELPPQPPVPTPRIPTQPYTLFPGDSLASVSVNHGVSIDSIRAANPDLDFSKLRPGDTILIPRPSATPAAAQ
ncbi:MAG TPA: LysM peptidoglycan-binding domain-containing protein [Candidatus Binatia bacterium]|jgi:LysM repeat protein|nr:LysM peptidoglycan-binding domain-containing protein [Candidatus Binatia bacterium]